MTDLQLAANGDVDHPAMPQTALEIAADAAACVEAGATLLHLHAFDDDGQETLEAEPVGRMLTAVRAACPGVAINVTTFASIVSDPVHRLRLIDGWTVLPDLIAANQGEEGIDDVSALLSGRGVGIEACVLSVDDVRTFLRRGSWSRFARLVVEPLEPVAEDAVALAEQMESELRAAEVSLPELHHGVGLASWTIMRRAVSNGHSIRTGLEDTLVLEDGSPAASNAQLVAAASAIAHPSDR
ncbi:3-keto-5-aminohexanoate cleavage protein [Curtobacterium sp. MCBA15_004]|uniref:3-keto-5-aminohexanoate cleavage protein n=1 Tax=Curtobacterium sp. MCBA15_004 TaxID=1898733 RepID=UPI0011147DC4|nr:3-keto-5-aminohexanoate cleavage protein [Curtobacterium sp. MCBA15_004]WIA96976.1 3-keto-5-aminohexanoate cleavage protein [Curtobacterium sp. MCBA15_004]